MNMTMRFGFGGSGRIPRSDVNLANMSDAHLIALGQQGNASHAQLLEMQSAQQEMAKVAHKKNIEVPKVNFYPSRHPDPRKARKQDIKQARKLLTPTKRGFFNPLRWPVADLILAVVCSKLNSVLPHDGQEIYSVFEIRVRVACKILNPI